MMEHRWSLGRTGRSIFAWFRSISFALGALVAISCGGHGVCPAAPDLPPECWEEQRAQLLFSELALRALEVYGRFDPLLYETNTEGSELRVRENLPIRNRARFPEFEAARRRLNADVAARSLFAVARAKALAACGEGGCPPTAYSIKITPVPSSEETVLSSYRWDVIDGAAPELGHVTKGFLVQYSVPDAKCAKSIAAPQVTSASSGVLMVSGPCPGGTTDGDCCIDPDGNRKKWTYILGIPCCKGSCPKKH
jgi:hypothetical protein